MALSERIADLDPATLRLFSSTLPPDDLAFIEEKLSDVTGEGWRVDPSRMAEHFHGEPLDTSWRTPPHVRYLAAKFRQLVLPRTDPAASKRQIWNVPGRAGKSRLGSQWGPAWALDRSEGRARIIGISYGDMLADENADAVRQILRAHPDELRCQLRPDRQRLDRFVTDAGGGILYSGINSTVTGFGAGNGGGLIIDDPFKNWQEAHSEARRDHVFNQYRGTLRNRLDDEEAFILIVHHRVHEDDLTARLVEEMDRDDEYGDRWDVTVLPSLAAENDVLGRAPGEPLDPDQFPLSAVMNRIASMGTYLASGLELQRPTPEEGNDIKRHWFTIDANVPSRFDDSLSSWDTTMKDKETGDFTVGQLWARAGSTFWCLAEFRGHFDQPTTRAAIALMSIRFPWNLRHVVESAASGPEVIAKLAAGSGPGYTVSDVVAAALSMTTDERAAVQDILRTGLPGVQGQTVRGDKRVRARAVTPIIETGNVHLPEHAPFAAGFLDEVSAFPRGTHDDRVDAMSQALSRLWGTEATIVEPEILISTRLPGMTSRFASPDYV
jgi:phage terminase large subunit-like protein